MSPAFLETLVGETGFTDAAEETYRGFRIFRSGSRRLEIDTTTGDVWMADDRLWRADFSDQARRYGQASPAAIEVAPDAYLRRAGLTVLASSPNGRSPRVVVERKEAVASRRELLRETMEWGVRQDVSLGVHARLTSMLAIPDPEKPLEELEVPLTGPSLVRGMSFDPEGRLVGFHGSVPRSLGEPRFYEAKTREESQAELADRLAPFRLEQISASTLAYEIVETDDGAYLQPVWHHVATIAGVDANHEVPVVSLPASTFPNPSPTPTKTPPVSSGRAPFSAGVWWLDGKVFGKLNAHGLRDELAAAGWPIVADRGDDVRAIQDWLSPYGGVQDADLAYYAGIAGILGWHFGRPLRTQSRLSPEDVGKKDSASKLYGSQGLKWIAISACGPLQDRVIRTGGDVFERWGLAFDGLHSLLGFGTQIGSDCRHGRLFARRLSIQPVIDAWLSSVVQLGVTGSAWAGALFAYKQGGESPREDRVGPDPWIATKTTEPGVFEAIWIPG